MEATSPKSNAAQLVQQGLALHQQGRVLEAEPFYRQTLTLEPEQSDALHLLGVVLSQKGNQGEAETLVRRALKMQPHHTAYHNSLGRILLLQGRMEEGIAALEEALRLAPQNPEAHFNVGEALLAQNHPGQAEPRYRRALELKPTHASAAFGLGRALWAQGDQPGALTWFQLASLLEPGNAVMLNQLGVAYMVLGHREDAQKAFDCLLRITPENPEVLANLAVLVNGAGQREAAVSYYERALAQRPDLPSALDGYIEVRRQLCAWEGLDELQGRIVAAVRSRVAAGQPAGIRAFTVLYLPFTPEEQLQVARDESRALAQGVGDPLWGEAARREGRLRIGYLTSDARNHPIGHLLAEIFRLHDRERFEVFVYSTGVDDGSSIRQKILLGAEHFREARGMTSAALAEQIAADGVQILVDLMGHTADTRMSVLARRPAPLQMHYLGFPGSTGADFVDYLITDSYITPPERPDLLAEAPVYLPIYQINGHRYLPAVQSYRRVDFGIAEDTFVYYCFNNNYKIAPEIYDVWMRILKRVPQARLALLATSETALKNLQKEAEQRGVDPQRLMFAGYMEQSQNIARQKLMDLFLDTPLYNAGATATDALWAGVPLLTVEGQTYISRVAGSLLRNVGLPELIMPDLQAYEEMAVALAQDRERLHALRSRLEVARETALLFDTEGLLRKFERAFEQTWGRFERGEKPSPLWVD
ncbi:MULTISPECIES: tetratricopeptide repeat protein [Acidithiobacillus]|jgi:predicted O-linked N-acetylglucosamine transferase (SPINDLY family)|uniref:O-linked N-acetylglucosamine transferase, SPINDLY family protein n=1 Tax=Acidithiobacillus TaxID=119977 RepID=UPI001C07D562|nr:tetratricopeptide repeat protein [Acidithiobacillus ferrooxidans]MBU2860186.1 tetratricopeptide repeat protein [Acidithiobacillus ferrooxidans]